MAHEKLVQDIISYIKLRLTDADPELISTIEQLESTSFFMVDGVLFSAETLKPVDDYIAPAVSYAIWLMFADKERIIARDLRRPPSKQLNIWKKPPTHEIPAPGEYSVLENDDFFIYDPQNIVKRSLQLLQDEYVQYEICQNEPVAKLIKRILKRRREGKYTKPYVVFIESDQVPSLDRGYNDCKRIRFIVSVTDKSNWDARLIREECREIRHQDDVDSYVAKRGYSLALNIMTSVRNC